MAFRDCLFSAVEGGDLTREEATNLADRYEGLYAQARLDLGDGEAASAARDQLAKELRIEAAQAKRRAQLQDAARGRVKDYLQGYRNSKGKADIFEAVLNKLEHYGLGGTTTVTGRAKAIVALAHGELTDVMTTFRRSHITGKRFNRPKAEAMVKEMLGEASGDASAKVLAQSASSVLEKLRQRFNNAGGAIGKLANYFPQSHDAGAMLRAGREKWKEFIKPLLDLDRMKDPLTGERFSAARLDQSLNQVWGTIATDGMNKLEPAAVKRGGGMVASQRADHRFLHFKNADSWMAYAREFGETDPIRALFDHINGMSKDIAAMEEFGPNPGAMVEWMKQLTQREAARAIEGKPTFYNKGNASLEQLADKLNYIPYRIDAVWNAMRGAPVISSRMATGISNVRNVLTSAQLGAASLVAATTDPFFDAFARRLSGLPIASSFTTILKTFSESTREQAVRSGMIWDDFLHTLGDQARYAGMLGGSEWSKWLADRTMQLSMLEPMTQARRHVFGLEFMGALADQAGKRLEEIDPVMRRWMDGYGITNAQWDVIRKTPAFKSDPREGGIIRPIDVAAQPGGEEAAERMLMMIHGQTERAVPTGTVRSQTFLTGAAPRGTVAGELLQSFLQYKSFGLSLTTLQLQAIGAELGLSRARGIGYAASLGLVMTLGGAMGLQLRHVSNGKDPQPMNDPRFWLAAAQTGGGFGLFGDFLFSDQTRFGHGLVDTMAGPTVGLLSDLSKVGIGGIQRAGMKQFDDEGDAKKDQTSFGRDLVNLAGRYTPVMSSLWYSRLAYRRMVLDQLQYLVDPKAHTRFRQQERATQRDTGQGFWWRPGASAPERTPNWGVQ